LEGKVDSLLLAFLPAAYGFLVSMPLAQGLDVVLRDRLVLTTVALAVVIACLAILYAYLRLEHATRGFYSGRLQTGAGLFGLAVIVVAYFVWGAATG